MARNVVLRSAAQRARVDIFARRLDEDGRMLVVTDEKRTRPEVIKCSEDHRDLGKGPAPIGGQRQTRRRAPSSWRNPKARMINDCVLLPRYPLRKFRQADRGIAPRIPRMEAEIHRGRWIVAEEQALTEKVDTELTRIMHETI